MELGQLGRAWRAGFRFPPGLDFVNASTKACSVTHNTSYPVDNWVPSSVEKRPGSQANHSSPFCAEIKNAWSYASTPQYVCIPWCLVQHKANIPFTHSLQRKAVLRCRSCIWRLVTQSFGHSLPHRGHAHGPAVYLADRQVANFVRATRPAFSLAWLPTYYCSHYRGMHEWMAWLMALFNWLTRSFCSHKKRKTKRRIRLRSLSLVRTHLHSGYTHNSAQLDLILRMRAVDDEVRNLF
jgi:hypothetical protein